MWVSPTGNPRGLLAAKDVHVWLIELDEHELSEDGLSIAEWERAKRFHARRDAARYANLHRVLRSLLGQYLGVPGGPLVFVTGSYGKPSLAPPYADLRFNVSYSAGRGLIAISRDTEVGIDLELRVPGIDMLSIARSCFAGDEVSTLEALTGAAQRNAFFDLWSRKEAYLKALGTGLSKPLDSFSMSADPGIGNALLSDRQRPGRVSEWEVVNLAIGPEFSGALATSSGSANRRSFLWPGR